MQKITKQNWGSRGYQLIIHDWYGRLGNNVIQLCHAIFLAIKSQSSIVSIPYHRRIFTGNLHRLDFSHRLHNKYSWYGFNIKSNFYFLDKVCSKWKITPNEEVQICQKYVLPRLRLIKNMSFQNLKFETNTKGFDKTKWDDTLVIHIRGGDCFKPPPKKPHPKYTQPPFAFYKKILREHHYKYRQVLIVTENDNNNP